MKRTLLIICLLYPFLGFSQNFEGKIIYENKIKSKLPNITDEQLTAMLGTQTTYFIKGGDYKTTSNGSFFTWQLYVNKDNKLYTKFSNSETLLWNDGGIAKEEVTTIALNQNVMEILGLPCDELIFNMKTGFQKFYFNSKWKADAKLYEKHKFQHWNEYVAKAQALPLKIILENEQFTIESIATEVTPMKLNKALFELPVGAITAPSPY